MKSSQPVLRLIRTLFVFSLFAILLTSCASDRTNEVVGPPAQFLELREAQAIATLHFPAGLYSLDSTDETGSYYRSTRALVKHSFAGPQIERGGIFVSKSKRVIRGYVIWAGALTKIGKVSPSAIQFRN